ncbi:MAG: IS1595 family transposase [Bacteroidota bacterium]
MPCCPLCSQETTFRRIPNRRSYQCSDPHCQYQLYPTAGTVFEKTRTPLVDWFYAMYLMTSTRNGVSAKELQRQLGVTYKCAFRIGHQIRKLLATSGEIKMEGIIEVDEAYIGGNPKNWHKSKHQKKENSIYEGKHFTPIVAMVERGGRVVTKVIERVDSVTMFSLLNHNVDKNSRLMTDGHLSYKFIGKLFKEHNSIKHTTVVNKPNYITKGDMHTNSVEGFFSHLKRTIKGTHIQVSTHLQAYANECAFRYTHRKQGQGMFFTILSQVSWEQLRPFEEAQRSPLCELDFLLKD